MISNKKTVSSAVNVLNLLIRRNTVPIDLRIVENLLQNYHGRCYHSFSDGLNSLNVAMKQIK